MATKKYSDGSITDGVTANGTDRWPVLRGGGNVWITPAYLATYLGTAGKLGLVARAHNSSGSRTFTDASTTVINLDTVDYDVFSAITTGASWNWTVPSGAAGRYMFALAECFIAPQGAAYAADDGVGIDIYKGGSYYHSIGYEDSAAASGTNHWIFFSGVITLNLSVADVLDLRFENFSGATRRLGVDAALEIYRVL